MAVSYGGFVSQRLEWEQGRGFTGSKTRRGSKQERNWHLLAISGELQQLLSQRGYFVNRKRSVEDVDFIQDTLEELA